MDFKTGSYQTFFFFFNSPLSHFSLSGGIEHRNWNSGSWYMYSVSVCKRLRLFAAVQRRTLYAKDIKYTMGEKDSTKHADANECYKERKREHLPSLPHSTAPHSPNPPQPSRTISVKNLYNYMLHRWLVRQHNSTRNAYVFLSSQQAT